jgi:hypothetical protein
VLPASASLVVCACVCDQFCCPVVSSYACVLVALFPAIGVRVLFRSLPAVVLLSRLLFCLLLFPLVGFLSGQLWLV